MGQDEEARVSKRGAGRRSRLGTGGLDSGPEMAMRVVMETWWCVSMRVCERSVRRSSTSTSTSTSRSSQPASKFAFTLAYFPGEVRKERPTLTRSGTNRANQRGRCKPRVRAAGEQRGARELGPCPPHNNDFATWTGLSTPQHRDPICSLPPPRRSVSLDGQALASHDTKTQPVRSGPVPATTCFNWSSACLRKIQRCSLPPFFQAQ